VSVVVISPKRMAGDRCFMLDVGLELKDDGDDSFLAVGDVITTADDSSSRASFTGERLMLVEVKRQLLLFPLDSIG
jgi:hypothetical protein